MTIADSVAAASVAASADAVRETVMSWPTSSSFGITMTGAAVDRRSLFGAAGVVWDDDLFPHPDDPRGSDYPFSYDVSDGRLLAAIDSQGLARRVVQGEGMRSVEGESIPGVYVEKDFGYVEGRFGVSVGAASAVQSTLLAGVLPAFISRMSEVSIHRVINVRRDGERSVLRCTVILDNTSGEERQVELTLVTDTAKETTLHGRWADAVADARRTQRVPAGGLAVLAAEFAFAPGAAIGTGGAPEVLVAELDAAVGALAERYGSLRLEDGQWFADFLVRSAELARQSSLHAADGSSIGSFWGSNATPITDVWTRDLFYTALSSAQYDLDDAVGTIEFLARTALPRAPWGRENEVDPREDGLSHSLGNAVAAIALAGLTAKTFGADAVFERTDHLRGHGVDVARTLLDSRPLVGELYPSHYISDGPSRGDFHTGSNVLAWYATTVLVELADQFGIDQAQSVELRELAAELRSTIVSVCVVDGPEGRMYVEGVNRDGSVVAGHDGEESDLTLAASYGFTGRFDPKVATHARRAFTPANPYFDAGARGVTFWDWDDYNGVTFPAYIHKLAGARSEADLLDPLEDIRRLTDLDGSLWWWPLAHRNPDPFVVKRGLGKCGWCAGTFVQRFVHDILGVRRDADRRSVWFSPAVPWHALTWDALPFLDGVIDVSYDASPGRSVVRLRNGTSTRLNLTLEAPVPVGAVIEDVLIDGMNGRYRAMILDECGRVVVRGVVGAAPGEEHSVEVLLSRPKPARPSLC